MSSVEEVRAICAHVADGLPMGLVAAARDRLEATLALLGSELSASTSPHAVAVLAGLTAMHGDIEQAAGALAVAATRARRYASGL